MVAGQAGREMRAKNVKAWIDNRYLVVRSIRSAKQVRRELRSSQLMVRNGMVRKKGG
jgi:hypothetical protein